MASLASSPVTHTSFSGHKDSVTCVEYSPSLSLLASSSDDSSVRLWDARAARCCVRCITGCFDKNPVQLVAWAPPQGPMPNSLFAACGRDVLAFDLRASEGLLLRTASLALADVCSPGEDGDDEISSLHVQPKGGGLIAAADDSGAVQLLELMSTAAQAGGAEGASGGRVVSLERKGRLASGHQSVCVGAMFRPTTAHDLVSGALDGPLAGWYLSRPATPSWHHRVPSAAEAAGSAGAETTAQSLNPPLVQSLTVRCLLHAVAPP